jgi:hypothetical protein
MVAAEFASVRRVSHGIVSLEDEEGRGWFLVASLNDRWNWRLTHQPEGKVVWCELSMRQEDSFKDSGAASSYAALPRRATCARQVPSAGVISDPSILRRVRDGLRELADAGKTVQAGGGL